MNSIPPPSQNDATQQTTSPVKTGKTHPPAHLSNTQSTIQTAPKKNSSTLPISPVNLPQLPPGVQPSEDDLQKLLASLKGQTITPQTLLQALQKDKETSPQDINTILMQLTQTKAKIPPGLEQSLQELIPQLDPQLQTLMHNGNALGALLSSLVSVDNSYTHGAQAISSFSSAINEIGGFLADNELLINNQITSLNTEIQNNQAEENSLNAKAQVANDIMYALIAASIALFLLSCFPGAGWAAGAAIATGIAAGAAGAAADSYSAQAGALKEKVGGEMKQLAGDQREEAIINTAITQIGSATNQMNQNSANMYKNINTLMQTLGSILKASSASVRNLGNSGI